MTHCAGISRFTLKTSRTKRRAACRVSVGMVDGSIWSANWMAMSLRRTSEDLSASRASVQTSRMNRFRCFTREYASKWSRTKGVLPHRDLLTCYSPRASVMAGKKWQRKWQRSLESQETLGKWSFPKAMALWGSQVRTLSAPPLQKKCSGRKAKGLNRNGFPLGCTRLQILPLSGNSLPRTAFVPPVLRILAATLLQGFAGKKWQRMAAEFSP